MRPLRLLVPLLLAASLAPPAQAQTVARNAELTLFRDRNFAGPTMVLNSSNSTITFSPRSARISGGPWLLCARPFFGGHCQELHQSTGKLSLHRSFSGTVGSARPIAAAAPQQPRTAPPPTIVAPPEPQPERSPEIPKS